MSAPFSYLSVCSGIEAATVAWNPLGWECKGVAEIDPFPCHVLHRRFGATRPLFMPDPAKVIIPTSPKVILKDPLAVARAVADKKARAAAIRATNGLPTEGPLPNFGDLERYKEWPDAAFDLLVGGTPCQAFSVAGLRKGLDDPRGNLALVYLGILDRYRPRWFCWENVFGVLSSSEGRDFGSFLGGVAQLGYGFAYRVLDAQFVRTRRFGRAVPQRRRRVIVVGYLGDWRPPAAVLFDPESLLGNPPPRREAGQGLAHDVAGSLVSSGRGVERSGEPRGQDPVIGILVAPEVSGTFSARDSKGVRAEDDVGIIAQRRPTEGDDVASPLTAAMGKSASRVPQEQGALVPVAPTLRAGGNSTGGDRPPGSDVDTVESLIAVRTVAPFDLAQVTSPANRSRIEDGLPASTLAEGSQLHVAIGPEVSHSLRADGFDASEDGTGRGTPIIAVPGEPIAFSSTDNGRDAVEGLAPTLRAMGHADSHPNGGGQLAVAFDMRGREHGNMPEGPHDTASIRAASGGSSRSYLAMPWAVRRLTPVECERLQGFPDGHTDIYEARKKGTPDGPRYKACGNSMAVNVMEWVGERIEAVRLIMGESGND